MSGEEIILQSGIINEQTISQTKWIKKKRECKKDCTKWDCAFKWNRMESKWLKLVIEYNEIKPYYIKKGIQEFSKEQNKGYEKEFVKFA